jgi:mono/diheme cytochrome c family protein
MLKAWKNASAVRRSLWIIGIGLALLLVIFGARIAIELIAYRAIPTKATGQNASETKALVERGAYLAVLGNCAACHTERGGPSFAGGKAIPTPFGAVFASNITSDPQHGIGSWSKDAFYRAMNQGVNAQGKLLTPAFPYTNYTLVSRSDSDALHAYFTQSVKPASLPNKVHELQFPFNTQWALAAWRVLYFRPDAINSISASAHSTKGIGLKDAHSDTLKRGQYLVRGLGHCSACHAERNALGGTSNDLRLSGALMPMQDWYAPSLHVQREAGLQHWPRDQVVALLKNGVTKNASVLGPMAEVVSKSTQFWTDTDLNAAAAYLQSLPVQLAPEAVSRSSSTELDQRLRGQGAKLYAQHCATCHGDKGQGLQVEGQVALPSLADNRAVTLSSSANLVRIILAGGYAPSTAGNPRPYGMPPFVHVLTDEDIASVATYIRSSWGNNAAAVSASQVIAQRRGVLQ